MVRVYVPVSAPCRLLHIVGRERPRGKLEAVAPETGSVSGVFYVRNYSGYSLLCCFCKDDKLNVKRGMINENCKDEIYEYSEGFDDIARFCYV